MKRCSCCGEEKSIELFGKNGYCKSCNNRRAREYRARKRMEDGYIKKYNEYRRLLYKENMKDPEKRAKKRQQTRKSVKNFYYKNKYNKEFKEYRLKINNSWHQKVKQKCVDYLGGSCVMCGYNKCNSALEFHHINPLLKDYEIGSVKKSFEEMKKELDKCALLCSNCHREIHSKA